MTIVVVASGPMFNGRAVEASGEFLDAALDEVAGQGYANVMSNLNASIQNPTPYYETQVTVDRAGSDRVVHDRDVIYGPWLEGTGSRNSPETSFRGYRSFRRAAALLDKQALELSEHVLQRYLPRMR
ncbi:hypothetical protein [Actinosynnema sp. NPDC023587]|uniref:hypothetical protein n=1 Tax=Actinosynnema sp. NPDC023587 TaxID=3154695 RepID=UPI0033EE4DF8